MRCRKGSASIEFALVGSVFFMVLIGTIEVGRLYFTQQSLREATAAAARSAMLDPALSGCVQPAAGIVAATPFLRPAALSLCVARSVSAGRTTLTIDAAYPFTSVLSVLQLSDDTLTEHTTVTYSAD